MILQENHKEFTVKCFAAYMKPSEVVKAFMQEFKNDLPKPPSPPQPPNYSTNHAMRS